MIVDMQTMKFRRSRVILLVVLLIAVTSVSYWLMYVTSHRQTDLSQLYGNQHRYSHKHAAEDRRVIPRHGNKHGHVGDLYHNDDAYSLKEKDVNDHPGVKQTNIGHRAGRLDDDHETDHHTGRLDDKYNHGHHAGKSDDDDKHAHRAGRLDDNYKHDRHAGKSEDDHKHSHPAGKSVDYDDYEDDAGDRLISLKAADIHRVVGRQRVPADDDDDGDDADLLTKNDRQNSVKSYDEYESVNDLVDDRKDDIDTVSDDRHRIKQLDTETTLRFDDNRKTEDTEIKVKSHRVVTDKHRDDETWRLQQLNEGVQAAHLRSHNVAPVPRIQDSSLSVHQVDGQRPPAENTTRPPRLDEVLDNLDSRHYTASASSTYYIIHSNQASRVNADVHPDLFSVPDDVQPEAYTFTSSRCDFLHTEAFL